MCVLGTAPSSEGDTASPSLWVMDVGSADPWSNPVCRWLLTAGEQHSSCPPGLERGILRVGSVSHLLASVGQHPAEAPPTASHVTRWAALFLELPAAQQPVLDS